MRTIGYITTLLLFTTVSFAQNIPNSGFENWNFFGDPDDWISTNALETMGIYDTTTVFEENTNVHSGSAALRAITLDTTVVDTFGQTFAGAGAITGAITSFSPLDVDFGFAYSNTALKLGGYFQYYPIQNDTGFIQVTLTKWNSQLNTSEIIGFGIHYFGDSTTSYSPFSVDISYSDCPPPDTAIIFFATTTPDTAIMGTELFLDSLYFETSTPNMNMAPIANDNADTTLENTSVIIPVGQNDTDPDNDSIYISGITQFPQNGNVYIIDSTMSLEYTPNNGFAGMDTIWYEIQDTADNPKGCDEAMVTVYVEDTSTGFITLPIRAPLRIYPNPASAQLNIEIREEQKGSQLVLYNMLGVRVLQKTVTNEITPINTTGFASGLYFCRLVNEKGEIIATKKFTVQP